MSLHPGNPLAPFLEQGAIVLDGGLATSLEARGRDLHDPLWSARLLIKAPEAIAEVHRDFLIAGADCIASASYQASMPGFAARGIDASGAGALLALSVRLATETRDAFWSASANRAGRLRPLVAASVGPYGAFLADGSEYTGDYAIGAAALREFHEARWRILAASGADLLACETIPSAEEAAVLLELVAEVPDIWAWVSFSCRDGLHLSDGSRLSDAARACDAAPRVAAVGINCTAPEHIGSLIAEARSATGKPVLVYPNSGERYDATAKRWLGSPSAVDLPEHAHGWVRDGASGVGGCCRVGPRVIAGIRQRLEAS